MHIFSCSRWRHKIRIRIWSGKLRSSSLIHRTMKICQVKSLALLHFWQPTWGAPHPNSPVIIYIVSNPIQSCSNNWESNLSSSQPTEYTFWNRPTRTIFRLFVAQVYLNKKKSLKSARFELGWLGIKRECWPLDHHRGQLFVISWGEFT